MEVVGFVFSTVALAGLFKDCLDLFSYISAARSLGLDAELLDTKLDVEKVLLLQWAERVRLLQKDFDKRLDRPETAKAISRVLASIHLLLSESNDLQSRYGMIAVDKAIQVDPVISGPRMASFIKGFDVLNFNARERQKHAPITKQIRWAIRDKDKFDLLIRELSSFIGKLNKLTPTTVSIASSMTAEDLQNITSNVKLQLVVEASAKSELDVARLAQQTSTIQMRILNSLWHYTLTERVDSLKDAHQETFQWALRPPRLNDDWDDLSAWLKSGKGTYWLSGKAGSGKSTLMKYLFQSELTHKLLCEWAGSDSLTVSNFFFWALGTSEQKSQQGLMRALLYQVLNTDPSLIPKLLPVSWRQLQTSETVSWRAPGAIETKEAFQKLGNLQLTERKLFFFIDGLDEYAGKYTEGIEFLRGLVQNPNAKVLVSSRPISDCVAAFSSGPKLQLQDLTKGDIATYVHDTLGSHEYMQTILASRTSQIIGLQRDICRKASGVFLWVTLACRSLHEGFSAYDTVSELQARVDELPPELEDLFQHMLNKIEPRYQRQAAKLLRICQRGIKSDCIIYALGLAIIDQHDLSLKSIATIPLRTDNERYALCKTLEGRLRSRCCGLLEVQYPQSRIARRQMCDRESPNKDPMILIETMVGFIHRSVYEFLEQPIIWRLNYLTVEDEYFEVHVVLSCILLHMAEFLYAGTPAWNQLHSAILIREAFRLLRISDSNTNSHACIRKLLLHFEDRIMSWVQTKTRDDNMKRYEPSTTIHEQLPESLEKDMLEVILPLAVEANLVEFVKMSLNARNHEKIERRQRFPLLYHAVQRPYLLLIAYKYGYAQKNMIQCLLTSGCDPNERFLISPGVVVTPWTFWLQGSKGCNCQDGDILDLGIAEIFIKAGADPEQYCEYYVKHFGTKHDETRQDLLPSIISTIFPDQIANELLELAREKVRISERNLSLQNDSTSSDSATSLSAKAHPRKRAASCIEDGAPSEIVSHASFVGCQPMRKQLRSDDGPLR